MKVTCLWIMLVSLVLISAPSFANLQLPYLIGEGMVVQRHYAIPIWGWGTPGERVSVSFAGITQTAVVEKSGDWRLSFPPREAGGPYALSVKQGDINLHLEDIWVGDVWVCSGQSNMSWLVRDVNHSATELANATDAKIRQFTVPQSWAVHPENRLAGGNWHVSSPVTTANFTAVGYFFAKSLRDNIDVPIGLIHSSWPGSNIEAWMASSLLDEPENASAEKLQKLVASEESARLQSISKVNKWPGALVQDLPSDNINTVAKADWSGSSIDETDWVDVKAPQLWEQSGFEGLDGVAWYRREFSLTASEARQDLLLNLARIDDADQTWVNGIKVGQSDIYSEVRQYRIPKDALNVGRNVIAIRVVDTGGGGGIYSDAELSLTYADQKKSLAGLWKFKVDKARVSLADNKNHAGTALYNKMMYPLFSVPVKGVIWYQGESNAGNKDQAFRYRHQFKKLIQFWRDQWKDKTLPFYWVQLANYKTGYDRDGISPWAILRESQSLALELPNTGQAIAIDVGAADDIHPRDKQTIGRRLALLALHGAYKKSAIASRGPRLKEFAISGNTITVQLASSTPITLASKNSNSVKGFSLAGKDKGFYPAQATLSGNKVILRSERVTAPIAARYAWEDNPESANIVDHNGLPAEPFRTDDW